MGDLRYQCPQCTDSGHLWEEVTFSGWRSIDAALKPTGEQEVDQPPEAVGLEVGCGKCDWRGLRSALVREGTDGHPVEEPIPGQLELS